MSCVIATVLANVRKPCLKRQVYQVQYHSVNDQIKIDCTGFFFGLVLEGSVAVLIKHKIKKCASQTRKWNYL